MTVWQGHWIWTAEPLPDRNAFVRFRRHFDYEGGPAILNITADSRYVLYVNGRYMGQGPVRAWPNHWQYDSYDLAPVLRARDNTLAVLVQRFGEGNFQYPWPGDYPGLLAQLDLIGSAIVTDGDWKASAEHAFTSAAPRISVQEGFEEQYDARRADWWTLSAYDDSAWPSAVRLRPAEDSIHGDLTARCLPFLTLEPVLPQRIVSADAVESIPYRFTVYGKPYLAPRDFSANMAYGHAYLATQVWSPAATEVTLLLPHKRPKVVKVNGTLVEGDPVRLRAGWNSLAASLRYSHHLQEYVVCVDGPGGLRFAAAGERGGAPWAIVGPFAPDAADRVVLYDDKDDSTILFEARVPEATSEAGEAFWASGDVGSVVDAPYFQPVQTEHTPAADVFAQAITDRAFPAAIQMERADGLLSGADWTVIHPAPDGRDVRLLLDFGRDLVGYHRFEVHAHAGTVMDFHNFEFIQPDGRYNFAEGMNNSLRYVCRAGTQVYQSYIRRGFQYSYLILRNMTRPVRIRGLQVLLSTYPQARRGAFACSDAQLDRIWQVGAHTLRLCSEDSYTDCPTYEQTGWVGDARNEALIDWAINGDPRLWFRHLELTAQSLDRSPLVESHVPSAWVDILPAWTFLWMRSCREYLLYTGDQAGARRMFAAVERNVEGFRRYLDSRGLFDFHGWNMFDWAAMDTPWRGVVTHNNCFAVHALRDAAELAEWLGAPARAAEWRALAGDLTAAVNAHLWNDEQRAYTDCLRDGRHSPVFSQQTQTVAYMAGVAQGERAERTRELMHHPPEHFVKAGSPFFEFFLLEAYQQEGRVQEFLDAIRHDWGFMVDMGATTFWEMWSGHSGRLTRSHCHGWSAAPTFFLSTYVLGVLPGGPNFSPAIVAPHPGDLAWCRGSVPTPAGDVAVQWENPSDGPFALRVVAPEGLPVDVRLPRSGIATLNGVPVDVK